MAEGPRLSRPRQHWRGNRGLLERHERDVAIEELCHGPVLWQLAPLIEYIYKQVSADMRCDDYPPSNFPYGARILSMTEIG